MMNWLFAMSEAATLAPQAAAKGSEYAGLTLLSKGLITTAGGLLGVFLVLALFFVTIRLMQRIKDKETEN